MIDQDLYEAVAPIAERLPGQDMLFVPLRGGKGVVIGPEEPLKEFVTRYLETRGSDAQEDSQPRS